MKTIKIESAKYVTDYKILFEFSDKSEQEIDFLDFLSSSTHPEIRKYLDLKLFKKFQVVDGDIDWNDFDMCFPVHDLHSGSIQSFDKTSKVS
jgi:hypothetical protein